MMLILRLGLFFIPATIVIGQNIPKNVITCGACRLIIKELENGIKSADPAEKIQVGSFRVNPDGTQQLNNVPYARSEVHVHELLETVCDKTTFYGATKHPVTKKTVIVNVQTVGETRNQAIVDTSDDIKSKLKFACNDILDIEEDEIVKFLSREYRDADQVFCHRERDYCGSDDVKPFPNAILPSESHVRSEKSEGKYEL
uniref:DUF3456 domain-containing protein n=1 Tax=Romanomermis culicivorax TaxID=13658 RepID=A0A915HRG6_ROMCU